MEFKNTFLGGKMNKDVDDRLVPPDQYRHAQNLFITKSEDSNIGVLTNILGNGIPYPGSINDSSLTAIGKFKDNNNNRIIWFVTSEDDVSKSAIIMFDQLTSTKTTLVSGAFLNFNVNYLITGVNLIEDLLFWTDNYNQPRYINVDNILNGTKTYTKEYQISVAKYSPIYSPILVDSGSTASLMSNDVSIESNHIEDKFIRLSYRFKFDDKQYSVIAPFSQICFNPQEEEIDTTTDLTLYNSVIETAEFKGMLNSINKVGIRIKLPSGDIYTDYGIEGIEILYKESDGFSIKVVDYIKVDSTTFTDNLETVTTGDYDEYFLGYTYESTIPYKVLTTEQYTRVFDRVPIKARAQESVGNRILYGDYLTGHDLPDLDYTAGYKEKSAGLYLEYKTHSVKQRRNYTVGVVLADKYGRKSPVILSENSSVYVENDNEVLPDWNGLCLYAEFNSTIPNAYAKDDVFILSNSSPQYTLVVTDNILVVTDYIESGSNFKIGDALVGESDRFAIIESITDDGTDTTITCNINIDDVTYESLSPIASDVEIPIIRIDEYGWYSYSIVVKQPQQEYYNVYTPGMVYGWQNSAWITLHGDNINKVPPAVSKDVDLTDEINPSDSKLFTKVINTSGGHGSATVNKNLKVISLGTASAQGATATETFPYNEAKNPILAEVESSTDLGTVYASSGATPAGFCVFETKPVESVIDLFWETSTHGDVYELNNAVLGAQVGTLTKPVLDSSTFPESLGLNGVIANISSTGGTGTLTYEVTRIVRDGIQVFGLFTAFNNGGSWELRLNDNDLYYQKDVDMNKFKVSISVIDSSFPSDPPIVNEEIPIEITNVAPVLNIIGSDTGDAIEAHATMPAGWANVTIDEGTFDLNETIFTVSAVNGSAGANNNKELRFLISQNPNDLFGIDSVTGEVWLKNIPYASYSTEYTDGTETAVNPLNTDFLKIKVLDISDNNGSGAGFLFDEEQATVTVTPDTSSLITLASGSSDGTGGDFYEDTAGTLLGSDAVPVGGEYIDANFWKFDYTTGRVNHYIDSGVETDEIEKQGISINSFPVTNNEGVVLYTITRNSSSTFMKMPATYSTGGVVYNVIVGWRNANNAVNTVWLVRQY